MKKGRFQVQKGYVGCIHTKGVIWLRRRRRLLRFQEKLALQGVMPADFRMPPRGSVDDDSDDALTESHLHFLAGNAFNAQCVLLVLISLFTFSHWDWGR